MKRTDSARKWSFFWIPAAATVSCILLLAGTAEVFVFWDFDARKNFQFEFDFNHPLSGWLLRDEIADRQNVRAEDLKLVQNRAWRKSDGAVVVWSYDSWSYRDEKGVEVKNSDVEGGYYHEIDDDDDVPLPGEHVAHFEAEEASAY